MHFNRNSFTCSLEAEKDSLNELKLGTFIGCFQSQGAEGMAVKGLKCFDCPGACMCVSGFVFFRDSVSRWLCTGDGNQRECVRQISR